MDMLGQGGDPLPEPETRKFPVPPERVILRPMGLSVSKTPDDEETIITLLVTPMKFVVIELPPEAHAHLLSGLAGGIVPATLTEMPR